MKRSSLWKVALATLSLWLVLAAIPLSGTSLLPTSAQGGVTLELIAQLSGSIQAIHVVGDYAYIGEGPRLVILDISDPANPTEVGRTDELPGVVWGVHVVGVYAHVADADEGGLHVISVVDKSHPSEVGFFDTPGSARGVYVVEDYAYVADFDKGLRVISVADKANPIEVGFFDTGGLALSVHVVGNYAYVADYQEGLRVISVADKANPIEVGFFDTPGKGAMGVHVAGDYAYIADFDKGLRVISIVDKANPTEVGFFDTASVAYGVRVVGYYAYIADGGDGLRVISVLNKANPMEVAFFDTAGNAYHVHVVGGYAYVADADGGLVILRQLKDKVEGTIPITGGSLSSTTGDANFTFPTDAFTQTVNVTYRHFWSDQDTGALAGIGHTFELSAVYVETSQPAQLAPSATYSVVVTFTSPGPAIEDTLGFYWWDNSGWVKEPTSVVDVANNAVTATLAHLGLFAMLGETHRIYLPLVLKCFGP
jgi:hypothetical protein